MGVFHKTPSSQFYLIETFSGPDFLSLRLLITCLLTVIDLTEGNGQNQSLGLLFWGIKALTLSFYFLSFFLCFNLIFCLVYVYTC